MLGNMASAILGPLTTRTQSSRKSSSDRAYSIVSPLWHFAASLQWKDENGNNRLFMAPHLVRAWSAYKDMRIHTHTHTHTHTSMHAPMHIRINSFTHTHTHSQIHTHYIIYTNWDRHWQVLRKEKHLKDFWNMRKCSEFKAIERLLARKCEGGL